MVGHRHHILVLHAETVAGPVAERLEAEHHARLEFRVLVAADELTMAWIGGDELRRSGL